MPLRSKDSALRRIGINALYLKPGAVGGTEIYLRGLLQGFEEIAPPDVEFTIFGNEETEPFSSLPWRRQPVRASNRASRLVYEQTRLPAAARQMDVLLNPGFTAPLIGTRNVTVFHDLQHYRHPEHFRWFDLPVWQVMLRASALRSTRLIAVSQATQQDIMSLYGLESTVVSHGVDVKFFEIGKKRAPYPFLLYVSTLHPHKNHIRLLRAFAEFRKQYPKFHLVLAGMRGFASEEVENTVRRLNLADWVHITGWITQEELYNLYRTAAAAVYPSTFEGFGMPILEALAAGVPLACSAVEPMESIAAGHALLFDPLNETSIANGLRAVIASPKDTAAAAIYARKFTWAEAARKTLAVLLKT